MLEALLIVAGIALVDSLNPGTIAPGLVFAVSSRPVQHVLGFTLGFFLVNFAGGILLVLGPGHWLLSLIPSPGHHAKHVLELAGGLLLLVAAVVLLALRERLVSSDKEAEREAELKSRRSGSAFATGAGIALAELPTAFPYFAAIAAITAADVSLPSEVGLVLVFNLLFLLPLFLMAFAVGAFPQLRGSLIVPLRRWMALHWPQVVAGILAVAGVALVIVGTTGLAGD